MNVNPLNSRRVTRARRQNRRQNQAQPVRPAPVVAPRRRARQRNRRGNSLLSAETPKITAVGRALRDVGGVAGGLYGMSSAGRALGATISRIFGQGDYVVNSVEQNSLMGGGPPQFGNFASGFKVKHREYICDISSTTAFTSQSFSLNPGMSSTFPWLSTVAANFEEYRLNGCCFYLNTTSGAAVASTNTALGLWGVVTQYDPAEPDFTTKQQAESYVGCQSAVPSQSLLHGIECKPKSNILDKMYVRTGPLPVTEDLKFYDWGKSQVFTSGSQNSNVIGELWVTYEVEFYKPRLPTGGYKALTDYYLSFNSANNSSPIGTTQKPVGNLGTEQIGTSGLVRFSASTPPGFYLIAWQNAYSTAATPTQMIVNDVAGSNVRRVQFFENKGRNFLIAPGFGTAQLAYGYLGVVEKTSIGEGTVQFSFPGSSATATCNLVITQMSPGLFSALSGPSSVLDELKGLDMSLLKKLLANTQLKKFLVDADKETGELDIVEEGEEEDKVRDEELSFPKDRPSGPEHPSTVSVIDEASS